jgi:DNA polymerase-3 subunit beta
MITATRKAAGTKLNVGALKAALAALADAVPSRSPRPVLLNVLLADGRITATDLEVQVSVVLPYDGDPLLLPFNRLKAIVNECNAAELTLAPDGTACVVRAGNGKWRLPSEPAAEFPTWKPENARPLVRLPCDQFARAAKAVVAAADPKEGRYAYSAVLIDVQGDKCWVVATDGRRLYGTEMEHDLAMDARVVLAPAHAVKIIARIAEAQADSAIQFDATNNELIAETDSATITVRLAAGEFPKWRKLVPAESDETATVVSRDELMPATRAAAIVTSENSRGVRYTFGGESLMLHGKSAEAGESSVKCDVQRAGPACRVKLNPQYVADWLRDLPREAEPYVEVSAKDGDSAVVFRCGEHLAVVMPLAEEA